ncbi:MAG: PqqD family protein [Elusimicrobiota bacterium]
MKLAQFVKFREEKFGGVLFETRSEKVFTLSPTGAAVVKEIASGGGDKEIVARLKMRYDDKSGSLEKEATEFIATLRQNSLITE